MICATCNYESGAHPQFVDRRLRNICGLCSPHCEDQYDFEVAVRNAQSFGNVSRFELYFLVDTFIEGQYANNGQSN